MTNQVLVSPEKNLRLVRGGGDDEEKIEWVVLVMPKSSMEFTGDQLLAAVENAISGAALVHPENADQPGKARALYIPKKYDRLTLSGILNLLERALLSEAVST